MQGLVVLLAAARSTTTKLEAPLLQLWMVDGETGPPMMMMMMQQYQRSHNFFYRHHTVLLLFVWKRQRFTLGYIIFLSVS
jgi:hypothetical protein